MKTLMLGIIALSAFPASGLLAQGITGTWQGTLQAGGKELRTVIKISATEHHALKAVFYSIDQAGQGIAASPVFGPGPAVKITVPSIAGGYAGKLSADGTSIVGTWTQGSAGMPLNLTRATAETKWALPEPRARPTPMAADANPEFEVATIKPTRPDAQGRRFRINGRSFSTFNTPLSSIIAWAYGIHPKQIEAGPPWLETEKFDLAADPDGEGQPNGVQWKTMVQKLIADRFKLAFHRETKEVPVYILVVGESGPKLTKSEGNPNGAPTLLFRGPGELPGRNATMADFAGAMRRGRMDRPVLDRRRISSLQSSNNSD